jgi:hypothetical protein
MALLQSMNLPRSARPLHLSALLLLAACGASSAPPAETAAAPSPSARADAAASAATTPVAPAIPRDPRLAEMARAARACGKDGAVYDFDTECAGYKAWHDNDELFADGKASDTIFSMYGDPDPKVHYLAMLKPIDPSYWQDASHGRALFAMVRAEKQDDILRKLADFVARVDADKAGLGAELKELGKHPSVAFRQELAGDLLPSSQTPLALEMEAMFLADPDRSVKVGAILALAGENTPPVEPVCQLLTRQLTRSDDDLHAVGLQAGSASKCPGMRELVTGELEKRTADPATVTLGPGVLYATALFSLCYRADSPAEKKKMFALTKRLVDPRIHEGMVRERGLDTLLTCDRAAGEKLLPTFARDKALASHVKFLQDAIVERKAREARDKSKKK